MTTGLPQRGISAEFEHQLTSGILWPLLQRVQHDDTLSLEIRNGYVDIYYRGGKLLGLRSKAKCTKFRTDFDYRYCKVNEAYRPAMPARPAETISTAGEAQGWVDALAQYKQMMDCRLSEHPKMEREYQQAMVRDNNRHTSGDDSDYVVIDVEYAQSPGAFPGLIANYRFDMVGFRWPAKGRTRRSGFATPVIMEMKVGDNAIKSNPMGKNPENLTAGLVKHVIDIERFLTPAPGDRVSRPYDLMCNELQSIFETKKRLGLPSLPKKMRGLDITEIDDKPEVLFILASHNPRSTILASELGKLPHTERADYGIATVSYTGHTLFADNIRPLSEFIGDLH